jgi:hypothetical protein
MLGYLSAQGVPDSLSRLGDDPAHCWGRSCHDARSLYIRRCPAELGIRSRSEPVSWLGIKLSADGPRVCNDSIATDLKQLSGRTNCMIDIRDHPISAGDDSHQAATFRTPHCATLLVWCPPYNFDWREWPKPSIIFVSSIDAQLPNKAFASVQNRIKRKKILRESEC